jgi:hypothetical protein
MELFAQCTLSIYKDGELIVQGDTETDQEDFS